MRYFIYLYFTLILIILSCNNNEATKGSIKTYNIEHQTWHTECLNVDKFRNGDNIPQAISDEEIEIAAEEHRPIRQVIIDTIQNVSYSYYNWYAIIDPRGLPPVGFHIPSKDELEAFISIVGVDKSKLDNLNINTVRDTRYISEENHLGGQKWWTSTPSLKYDSDAISFIVGGNKQSGISMYFKKGTDKKRCLLVRCLKDY
jgi:uncharacterized protein (TIGR02145 family)